jgi:hypothetical protein
MPVCVLDVGVKSELVEPPGKVWRDPHAVRLVILAQLSISVLRVGLRL